MTKKAELKLETESNFGIITLRRPEALNALSLGMIMGIKDILKKWDKDPFIHSVIIKSSDIRGFCAGGDIKVVAEDSKISRENKTEAHLVHKFFAEEYSLNSQIYNFNKPYISFINGIVMGGGNGISMHGSHRVINENTKFAMPETKIGFFPDIGSMNFLTKCPGYTGLFLAMTGNIITGKKIADLGIATHFVPIKQWETVQEQILLLKNIDQVLNAYKTKPETIPEQTKIDKYFSLNSVEEIFQSLKQGRENDNWCKSIHEDLQQRCPTSLKVAFKHFHLSKKSKNIEEILKTDYMLGQNMAVRADFYEGVRALLIEKTNDPKWFPSNINDVKDEDIEVIFNSCLNDVMDLTISS